MDGEKSTTSSTEGAKYSEFTVEEAIRKAKERIVIPSGSSSMDSLLGGGYRTGEIVEIFGESKTGKTQLALQAALSAASMNYIALFVDTEATFRPERLVRMADLRGLDPEEMLSRVFCIRAENTTRQNEVTEMVPKDARVSPSRMVIVDTVSKNFNVEFSGEKRMPTRQAKLNIYLSGLARDAYLSDRAVLLTNRVASIATASGRRETDLGGLTLRKHVRMAVHLKRRGPDVVASALIGRREINSVKCSLTENGFE